METHNTSIPKLPNDVIVEILARLPVKSLLRFKSVSKSWLKSIADPKFIKAHLRFSEKDSDSTRRNLALNCHGNLMLCSLRSLLREPFAAAASESDVSTKFSNSSVAVVGSCDGLVCVAVGREDLFLWNPSTGKLKQLPDFGAKRNYDSYFAYGLGYDESSDDYKIVGIFNSDKYSSEVITKVYSLKTDRWRRIANFEGRRLMADSSKFAKGKLHWIASGGGGSPIDSIVSLDLGTEEYESTPLPCSGSAEESCFYSRIGVAKGRLFVFCSRLNRADIWIMDDCEGGNWAKLVTVPYVDDLLKYSYATALDVLDGGEVLLLCGSKFAVFDPKDGSFDYPETRNCGSFAGSAATFVESLVSPFGSS